MPILLRVVDVGLDLVEALLSQPQAQDPPCHHAHRTFVLLGRLPKCNLEFGRHAEVHHVILGHGCPCNTFSSTLHPCPSASPRTSASPRSSRRPTISGPRSRPSA